jgi:hypothetical protein
MSALCQKRTYAPQQNTAKSLITDKNFLAGNVHFLLRVVGPTSKEVSDENFNYDFCNNFTRRDFGGC